jgi:molybdopterin-containing oxidoreductase family iron-sulfur binding subunit
MSKLIQIASRDTGKKYWRSLGELYDRPEFKEWVAQEFPGGAEMMDTGSRRNVLKLMAASFGLAGLTACRRPEEKILPHSVGIEQNIPGKPQFYRSIFTQAGYATGIEVETHDGRPTKIEGNPEHPYSNGATSAFMQASVLDLYDPDRSRKVLEAGKDSSWEKFEAFWKQQAAGLGDGAKLRFLSAAVGSPTLSSLRDAAMKKFPKAKWVEYEPVSYDAMREGVAMAVGTGVEAHAHYHKAKVVVSLDCDFLGVDSATVLPIRQFADGRRIAEHAEEMNRLYAVEGQFSLTGAMADHRLRMKVADVQAFAAELASAVGALPPGLNILSNDKKQKFLTALVRDLKANEGKSLVVAGPRQPAVVHALALLINQALGNFGTTVTFTKAKPAVDQVKGLTELAKELAAGYTLVILGGNPAFTAPADLRFGEAMKKATTIHLGLDVDETAKAATWHLPEAHYLEAWGDGVAPNGLASVQQPMIQPLYGGKSAIELVAMMTGAASAKGYDLVRGYWLEQLGGKENAWRETLHQGFVAGSAAAEVKPAVDKAKVAAEAQKAKGFAGKWEVAFYPSGTLYDGRYANNGWMQECPDPMTKAVWGNAALISPKTARDMGVADGDVLKVTVEGFALEIPARIQPGQADQSVAINLGYGRSVIGRVGKGVGANAYAIRTTKAFWFGEGSVEKTGTKATIASTQEHHRMEEPKMPIIEPFTRPTVREATLEEYKKNPKFAEEMVEHPPLESLHPDWKWDTGHQWGMAIDLNACVGCNACIIACQSENNIPIVGNYEVMRGREMHWIRLDRYYTGPEDEPQAVTQPVNCQQCENAPCENVCPVAATVHSPEGLNDMAYNRCVGTRYCANNCPYKVRRFNYLNWHRDLTEVGKMVHNPDVSVRMRGVMEKCTYCTQRIAEARIAAKADNRRPLRDGDIQTACQQACPAQAIVFGDIRNPESAVAKAKKQERNYAMLAELNVKPRTTYLAKLRNPNPDLA